VGLELRWLATEMSSAIRSATFEGLQAGGVHLHTKCKINLSIPQEKVKKVRKRNTSRGPKGSTYLVVVRHSRPGEPPRLGTGFGRDNTVYEGDRQEMAVRVGIRQISPFNYMFHHEVTGRSWLRRTLFEETPAIEAICEAFSVGAAKRDGLL